MSISKWAYIPDQCDGDVCVGDCDYCPKTNGNMAIIHQSREEEGSDNNDKQP